MGEANEWAEGCSVTRRDGKTLREENLALCAASEGKGTL